MEHWIHQNIDVLKMICDRMQVETYCSDDLHQDAVIRLLNKAESTEFESKNQFLTYFTTIVRNLVRDHFRSKKQRYEVREMEKPVEISVESNPTSDIDTVEIMKVAKHLLKPHQLNVIIWRTYGFTFDEISKMDGRTPNAIRSEMFRSQRVIREFLETRAHKYL